MKIPGTKWRTRDVRDVSFDFVDVYHFHTGWRLGAWFCSLSGGLWPFRLSSAQHRVGPGWQKPSWQTHQRVSKQKFKGCHGLPVASGQECWLIIPMWSINISGNALVIKKPSVVETLGSTIVGHQKFIMFMSPVSGTFFSKVLLHEPVVSCQTSSFNNSAIWGTFLDQFISRIKISWHFFFKHVHTKIPRATLRSRCTMMYDLDLYFKTSSQMQRKTMKDI